MGPTLRHATVLILLCWFTLCPTTFTYAQSSGSRGGVSSEATHDTGIPALDPETAERYIVIEGSSEVRVQPTEIRVVLAVTAEAETAKACHDEIQKVISALKAEWTKMQISTKVSGTLPIAIYTFRSTLKLET